MAEFSFELIQCFSQVGVFASRSSLALFYIRKLHFLCLIQFIFFLLWICFATFIDASEYILFSVVFNVGLVAGFTYVNTIYMILKDSRIPKSEKEVSLNVNGMFSDTGIIANSVFGVIFKMLISKQNS